MAINGSAVGAALTTNANNNEIALGVGLGVGIPAFLLIVLMIFLYVRYKKTASQTMKMSPLRVRASLGLQHGCTLSPIVGPRSAHAYMSAGWHHPRAQAEVVAQPVSVVVGAASASSDEKGHDAAEVSSVEIQMTSVACPPPSRARVS